MDFQFSEEQEAIQALAREIFENEVTTERLKAIEASGEGVDEELWARLAETNLLGLAIPEAQGGMGMGFLELCLLLHEMGRAIAPVPLLPALVEAALPIAEFGTDAQKDRWLAPLSKGELLLSGGGVSGDGLQATKDGEGWTLAGHCSRIPAVHLAKRLLLKASDGEAEFLVLVDPKAPGFEATRNFTSRREPVFDLKLQGVPVGAEDVLRAEGICSWVHERTLVAIAATQVGVSERSLEITTAYLGEREQFGAPLASLTAVQHRCADSFIGLDAMRWTTWMAASRLVEGRSAQREAWAAKYWAAQAGSRIANAMQHLHGGMGVDMDYPIHRYFFWSKALELASGAGTLQLLELGRDMARTGPEEFE